MSEIKFYDISKIENMKDELMEFKRGEKMTEEKAQNFINELDQLFTKYELLLDPYIDSYDNVCVDVIDKNENIVIDQLEMNFDDYSFTGFFHLPNENGLKSFIASKGNNND